MEEKKQKSTRNRLLRLGGIGVLLVSLGSKLKAFIPLLKFGKFGGTLLTMIASVWAYALLYTWQFSVGLVIMIFIHEMGHVIAAKQRGLPASAPAFIPFVGALIMLKRQPQDAETEAYVAYGGPLFGTIGALLCYGIGVWTGEGLYYAIAFIGFLINLFNLVPIHPLDGGRIAVAITRWLWVVGLILGLILIFYLKSIILILVYLMFAWEIWATFRGTNQMQKAKHQIEIPPNPFEEAGVFVPGKEHRRELPFVQYCNRETKQTYVEIRYPGVGTLVQLEGVPHGIHRVELIETKEPTIDHDHIKMTLQFTYTPATALEKNERYYQVEAKKRWIYGFAYVGLAAVLVSMIWISQTTMQTPLSFG